MLNIGGSRSTSNSYSQGTSSSFGIAESVSQALSDSTSRGGSQARSTVFGGDVFARLFGGASNVAGQIATGDLTQAANGLFESGLGFLSQLDALSGGGAAGPGEEYLSGRLTGGDALLQDQIKQVGSDLEQFFGESVLPQIRREAIGAGALGSDREGIATGIAGRGLVSEFARAAIALRSNDQTARDSAAATLAGLQANRRLGSAGAGLSSLPAILGIQESGSLAALSPFLALSEILGSPTVLTDSDAFQEAMSTSRSTARSASAEGSESQQTSTSTAKSRAFSFGLGS
jgi:hypothetical protein